MIFLTIMFLYVRQQTDLNMAIWNILHTIETKMYECRRCVCVVACFLLFAQLCLSRPGLAVCCPPPFCITVFPSLPNLALRPACTLSTSSLHWLLSDKEKTKTNTNTCKTWKRQNQMQIQKKRGLLELSRVCTLSTSSLATVRQR